jgi:hypothetical protein
MTSYRKSLFVILLMTLSACGSAKSPLENSGQDATFEIYPDRVHGHAELNSATDDSFGRPRTQILHFVVCLQNLVSGQNIVPGMAFAISDGSSERVRDTDPNGCVHWDEAHSTTSFAPQRNLRVRRVIRGLGNHRGSRVLTFNVKPWLEGDEAVTSELNQEVYADSMTTSSTFGFNDSYPVDKTAQKAARLDIANNQVAFQYIEVGQDKEFSVDPYLNLSIPYRFAFSFQPMITHKIFSGASVSDAITSGKLKVTFVFFASAKGELSQDTHYLTSAQVEEEVGSNGRIAGTVVLKYPHMLFASGRQTVLIQVSSVDDAEIQSQTFSASLSYIDQQTTITLLRDTRDGEALHTENQRLRFESQKQRPPPFMEFLNNHDILLSQVTDFPANQVQGKWPVSFSASEPLLLSREELSYALQKDGLSRQGYEKGSTSMPSVKARLCRAYMALNQGFGLARTIHSLKDDYVSAVRENSEFVGSAFCGTEELLSQYVKIQQFDFVEELGSTTPRNVNMIDYGNQEFGVYYSNEHSRASINGFAIQVPGFSMLGGLLDLSHADVDSQSLTEKGNFGKTQIMAVDVGTLEIYAKVKSCVLISSVRKPFTQKPWLICEPKAQPAQWIPEQYFFYSQIFASTHSPFIDPFSSQTGVKVFIRGKTHMNSILHVLEKADFKKTGFNVFVHAHVPNLSELDTLQNVDALTDQEIPGAFGRD